MRERVVVWILLSLFATPAGAMVVIDDHFNDGSLAPEWSVSFSNATGWDFVESGSDLTVSAISPATVNPGSGGNWSRVVLSQSLSSLTNFTLEADLAWTSGTQEPGENHEEMQAIAIWVEDSTDSILASVFVNDSWFGSTGAQFASAGSSTFASNPGSLPESGTASVVITRVDGTISVLWNGVTLATGSSSIPIAEVSIVFDYYPLNDGMGDVSLFGTESIDRISLSTPPEAPLLQGPALFVLSALVIGLGARALHGPTKAVSTEASQEGRLLG